MPGGKLDLSFLRLGKKNPGTGSSAGNGLGRLIFMETSFLQIPDINMFFPQIK